MMKSFRRVAIGLILGTSLSVLPARPAWAADAPTQVVSVDQLENEAFAAIRDGQFDKTSQLLAEAASLGQDPQVQRMAKWAGDFQSEQQKFAAERKQEFDKDVSDAQKLMKHGMPDYALDIVEQAYLRAVDKDAFRHDKWVDDLVKQTVSDAQNDQSHEQWLAALRIYSDLTGLDPATPEWKTDLNQVMRRLRLLSLYAPDQFSTMKLDDLKASRDAAEVLRDVNAPPIPDPTTQPSEDSEFKLDWHDVVQGVTPDMLADALIYAQHDYYRDAPYSKLLLGGLNGMKIMATTHGLEKAFPGLGDADKRTKFLDGIQDAINQTNQLNGEDQEPQVRVLLDQVEQLNRDTVALPDEVFVSEFTDAALSQLDPFSSMIWPTDLEEFNKSTQGEFSGIGVQIQSETNGDLRIVTPLEDSPAYKAGIKADDVITFINGKSAKWITPTQAVKVITGPPQTPVDLTIKSPDGSSKNYTIIRQTINVASIKGFLREPGGSWDYFVDPDNKIGYIRLTNFTKNSGPELIAALQDLKSKNAKGLILDLRDNPGGLLSTAVEVASQFIRNGVVVSTHPDRETENRPMVETAAPDDQTTDMPLVVLVNQYSASASEIVSGALKDDHRAIIVGERTFGKGSVQMLYPLAAHAAFLKLTTSHYYLPSGRCLHRDENSTVWGVDPDVKIEVTPKQMQAVIDARQKMEVLRATAAPTTQPVVTSDMVSTDPQLSAALLVLRLKLAGGQI